MKIYYCSMCKKEITDDVYKIKIKCPGEVGNPSASLPGSPSYTVKRYLCEKCLDKSGIYDV